MVGINLPIQQLRGRQMKALGDFTSADIERFAAHEPFPGGTLGDVHLSNQGEQGPTQNESAFKEACWICSSLAAIMPEVPIQSLMAALADDPEAFELVENELLEIRARLIRLVAN